MASTDRTHERSHRPDDAAKDALEKEKEAQERLRKDRVEQAEQETPSEGAREDSGKSRPRSYLILDPPLPQGR